MPKINVSWVKPYPEIIVDGENLFCKACTKIVSTFFLSVEYFSFAHNWNLFNLGNSGCFYLRHCVILDEV